MKKIKYEDIRTYKIIPNGDSGRTAICYFYDNNTSIKIFYNVEEIQKSFLPELINYNNKSFAFPIDLVYIDDILIGHTMDYVEGDQLKEIPLSYKLNDLINAYKKIYKDIEKVSEDGISFRDLHCKNVIIGDNFFITDTARFVIDKSNDLVTLQNLEMFNRLLITKLMKINKLVINSIKDKKFSDGLITCDSLIPFLRELQCISENVYEESATLDIVRKLKLSQIRKI